MARVLLTPTIRILTAGTAPKSFPLGADVDMRPLLRGLPDDRCPCPHWGYVLRGRLVFTVADYQETFEAGDGFYVPPGDTPVADAGTEYVQFSPADHMHVVDAAIQRDPAELQPFGSVAS